jgi:hypothetical protein
MHFQGVMKFLFRLVKIKILEKWWPFPVCNLKWLKIANFARLYYPHFTTFRNETLEYYLFCDALSCYDGILCRLVEIKILVNWGMVHCPYIFEVVASLATKACSYYCHYLHWHRHFKIRFCGFLMDVNEEMSYECCEYMYPHLNIHNSSTHSHTSEEENRT